MAPAGFIPYGSQFDFPVKFSRAKGNGVISLLIFVLVLRFVGKEGGCGENEKEKEDRKWSKQRRGEGGYITKGFTSKDLQTFLMYMYTHTFAKLTRLTLSFNKATGFGQNSTSYLLDIIIWFCKYFHIVALSFFSNLLSNFQLEWKSPCCYILIHDMFTCISSFVLYVVFSCLLVFNHRYSNSNLSGIPMLGYLFYVLRLMPL